MDDLLKFVQLALARVYTDHSYLIENQVSERGIVFWFGVYFHELIQGTKFAGYDLDVEYNRNLNETKRTEHSLHSTYPDLILHERGSNDNNVLVMEFKTWWDPDAEKDLVKIMDFTHPDSEYKYELGLSILIGRKTPSGIIVQNGEVVGGF